jgi:hypothetical protein
MATVRVRIVILTVRITLSVCPFNRMAHTANSCHRRVGSRGEGYKQRQWYSITTVLDLKRKIAVAVENKSSDATAEGSVEENKSSDATAEGSVEENKSSDATAEGSVKENKSSNATAEGLVEENKSSDATAEGLFKENKSSDATAEGSVKPAMVSLSALSAMSPSPGPKADEYQPATQYSPSPGPSQTWTWFTEKNRPRTRSTMSPDPKKKQSPVYAVADESLMHSGRNLDALVGIDSQSKAAFHRTLRRHPKYTQAYLDHAYNIVHDFRKCDIRVLHIIELKEGEAVQDDEDKKDCKPDPTERPVDIGSPPSITTDTPSNQMVTGFPPTPDEFVYVEEDCVKYVHASGPVDIGCEFEAVDELVLSNYPFIFPIH